MSQHPENRITTTGNRVPNRNARPGAGDFTGRTKAEQAREQKLSADQERAEGTLDDSELQIEQEYSVYDPQTQQRLDDDRTMVIDAGMIEEAPQQPPPVFGRFQDDEPVLSGKETDAELAPMIVERPQRAAGRPMTLRNSMVTIRVNSDLEQMTYGMRNGEPNNFNFKEGFKYRLPVEVAEHLDRLGYVGQWVTT